MIAIATKEIAVPSPDDLLGAKEAAAYLQQAWQRPFTAKDFSNLRLNAKQRAEASNRPLSDFFPIAPVYDGERTTIWRRSDLEFLVSAIPAPRLREEIRGTGKRKKRLDSH